MNNLGDYLDKFKKIFSSSKFQKDAVLSIIKNVGKIELKPEDIDIKDFKVILKTSPAVKNAVFMYKQKILIALKEELGTNAPNEIR